MTSNLIGAHTASYRSRRPSWGIAAAWCCNTSPSSDQGRCWKSAAVCDRYSPTRPIRVAVVEPSAEFASNARELAAAREGVRVVESFLEQAPAELHPRGLTSSC